MRVSCSVDATVRIIRLGATLAECARMGLSIETMKPGDSARVTGLVAGDRGYRQRLLAMGLTPGAVLEVRRKAPLGDPVEISVRNFTLTLRKSEAAILELEAV